MDNILLNFMKLKLFFAFSLSIVLITSCQKDLTTEKDTSSEALITKFFKSDARITSEILYLKMELQNLQKKNPFAEGVIKMAGFPKWEKTIIVKNRKSTSNSVVQNNQNLESSYIIPIVGLSETNVTGAITVEPDMPVKYHLILLNDFAQHGLSNDSFITAMMLLDSKVFGYDRFKINSNSIQNTKEII